MAEKIGLEAILEMSNFNKGMKEYTRGIDDMEGKTEKGAGILGKLGGVLGGVATVAAGAAVAGFGALAGIIATSVKEAQAAQQVEAQLDQVLRSTGGTAGMTKDEILGLADALSQVTPFEDDIITATETVLLQFQNINKETFPQATELALDLAQRLGIDTASAAKLLGKALEEPGEGLTRLRQAGVSFTDEQEAMIKKMVESGDVAGAQRFIMDELSKSVGGAARAAGDTFAGKMEILNNKIGNVKEAIGTAFLPILTSLAEKFSEFVTKYGPQIAQVFQDMAGWIMDKLIPAIGEIVTWIRDNLGPVFDTVTNWFQGEGSSSIGTFVGKIMTVLGPAIEFAQRLFGTLIGWVQENWPLIRETISTVMEAVRTVIEAVLGAIRTFWEQHGEAIMEYVSNMWTVISTVIETTLKTILDVFKVVMQLITGDTEGAMDTLRGIFERFKEAALTIVGALWDNIKILWDKGVEIVTNAWNSLWDKLIEVGANIVLGIQQGIENAWEGFKAWLQEKINLLPNWLKQFMGIASPAKVMMPIGESMVAGLQAGWEQGLGQFRTQMQTQVNASMPMFSRPAVMGESGGGGMVTNTTNNNLNVTANYARTQNETSLRQDLSLWNMMMRAGVSA